MAASIVLLNRNTQYLNVILLDSNNQPVNDAYNVVANLSDASGVSIPDFPGLAITYVAGSRGKYQGILPSGFEAPVGSGYVLNVSGYAEGGAGFSRDFPVTVIS